MSASWSTPYLVQLASGSEADEHQKVPEQGETCTVNATVPIDDPRSCFELFQDGLATISEFEEAGVIGGS